MLHYTTINTLKKFQVEVVWETAESDRFEIATIFQIFLLLIVLLRIELDKPQKLE
jgi:hypothetical protein